MGSVVVVHVFLYLEAFRGCLLDSELQSVLLSWFKLSAPVVTVVIVSRSSVEYFCSCILLLRNWVLFGTGILEPSVMAAETYVWHKLTL